MKMRMRIVRQSRNEQIVQITMVSIACVVAYAAEIYSIMRFLKKFNYYK